MKRINRIACVIMVCIICLAMSITVSASGKRLNDLSKNEICDIIRERIVNSYKGLNASLMYDECKEFVDQLQIPTKNYDTSDCLNDFKKWYKTKTGNMVVHYYNEKVIDYLRDNPGADLVWSTQNTTTNEYTVYDKNVLVDRNYGDENIHMQYSPENIDNVIIWTYDSSTNKYIGTNLSGSVIKTLDNKGKTDGQKSTETSSVSKIESSDKAESPTESAIEDYGEAPVEEQVSETVEESGGENSEDTSSDNSTVTTIIIVASGIVIAVVFAFLIIRQKKRRV